VGAGVGISGFRADLGLGDDFFGNREDAYSETIRQRRWDWYVDDFSARLKPNAKRVNGSLADIAPTSPEVRFEPHSGRPVLRRVMSV
jgi:hypothetical protein